MIFIYKMKGLSLIKPMKIEMKPLKISNVENFPLGKKEVLIKTMECGICDLDLSLIEGEWITYGYPKKLPLIPGHEILGIVEEVGEDVEKIKEKDEVVLGPIYFTCGNCESCLKGKENLCEKIEITGITVNGGLAEFVKAKEEFLFKINKEIKDYAIFSLCHLPFALKCLENIEPFNEKIGLFGFNINTFFVSKLLKNFKTYLIINKGDYYPENINVNEVLDIKEVKEKFDLIIVFSNLLNIQIAFNSLKKGGKAIIGNIISLRIPHIWEEKNIYSIGLPTRYHIKKALEILNKEMKFEKETISIENVNEKLKEFKYKKINKKLSVIF